MEVPDINLGEHWQKALDRFIEIGYFDGSPDNGGAVRVFFSHLEKLKVNVVPKAVLWREEDEEDDSAGYYLLKWDKFLLLLYLDSSSEICSYPGPISYNMTSYSEILSHLEKNLENYHLIT